MTKKILDKIEQLAAKTANEAFGPDIKFGDRIEALKVLTPIYTLLRKRESREPEEDETTMAGLAAELEKVENGVKVQHRRGRRTDA